MNDNERKIKICILDYCGNFGGGLTYVVNLVRALKSKKDLSCVFVSYGQVADTYQNLFIKAKIKINILRIRPNNFEKTIRKRIFSIPYTTRLFSFLKNATDWSFEVKVDMLGSFDLLILPWGHRHKILNVTSMPVLLTIHDTILADHPRLLSKKDYQQEIESYMQNKSERNVRFIAVSNSTKNSLCSNFLICRKKVVVIPNGSDHLEAKTYRKVGSNMKNNYYFYAANTFPHKNHETLFRGLERSRSSFKLVLSGLGTDLASNRDRRSRKLNKLQKILFKRKNQKVIGCGYVTQDKYFKLLAESRAVIFPSLAEGFGFPVLEAIFCGKPLICADIPVLRETVKLVNGKVIWFDPKNEISLSDAINDFEKKYSKQVAFFK